MANIEDAAIATIKTHAFWKCILWGIVQGFVSWLLLHLALYQFFPHYVPADFNCKLFCKDVAGDPYTKDAQEIYGWIQKFHLAWCILFMILYNVAYKRARLGWTKLDGTIAK